MQACGVLLLATVHYIYCINIRQSEGSPDIHAKRVTWQDRTFFKKYKNTIVSFPKTCNWTSTVTTNLVPLLKKKKKKIDFNSDAQLITIRLIDV